MLQLPEGVEATRDPGGRDAFRLSHGRASVLVATCGAQVLSFRDARGDEILWSGSRAEHLPDKPVRGGVPLVFPWFGDHADRSLPAHGFARNRTWHAVTARARANLGPELVLALDDDKQSHAMLPQPFRLELRIALGGADGGALELSLTVHNPGSAPLRCEQALHTYFAIGDLAAARVHGLENVRYFEQAGAPGPAGDPSAPVEFRGEVDRIYQDVPDRIELHAPGLRRRVVLTTSGARSAIVWNPWQHKGERLSQLAADDWRRFCCIESANVREHAVTVPPSGRHTLAVTIASASD